MENGSLTCRKCKDIENSSPMLPCVVHDVQHGLTRVTFCTCINSLPNDNISD